MAEPTNTNGTRNPLYVLSESSPIRLGLALAFVAGVLWLANSLSTLRSDFDDKYVSKDVFTVRMDALTKSIDDLKSEIQRLQDQVHTIERDNGVRK
jgi:hypothetical protein